MKRRCIVVFRANDVCHLGVARSLARLDYDIVSVVWCWPGAPEFYSNKSRYLGRVVKIHNPGSDAVAAREDIRLLLLRLKDEYRALPLLMPTSDSILTFLLDSPELWELAELANAWNFETTKELLDKFNLSQKLQFSGIRQPVTRRCTADSVRNMRLPFIVKPAVKDPVNSFYAEFAGAKALFIRTESDRRNLLDSSLYLRYPLVAQEYIDSVRRIDDMPVYIATNCDGEIIHCSSVDKVFVHPAGFGTAYIVKEQSEAMVAQRSLEGFVESTGIRGLVMLEFIRGKDEDFYFIEANPRPWLLIDFQRLRGRNYFYYLNQSTSEKLPEAIDKNTFYIELTGLCKAFEKLHGREIRTRVIDLLASLEGPKRLSTFDENDSDPLTAELQKLGEHYGPDFVRDINSVLST